MSDEIDMSLIGEEFIGSLEYLLDYVFMPSFQGERTLAPFFFWHIDEILNCYFNEDPEWSGKYKIISLEFPFKKDNNNQSDNVDILLINTKKNFLVLLEIKMVPDVRISDKKQFQKYINLKKKILKSGKKALILLDDLKYLASKGCYGTRQKYANLYEYTKEVKEDLCRISDVKIVYLVPDVYANKMEFKPDAVIRFSELPKNISGSGSIMWKYYIKPMLNYICRRFDNRYIPIDQQMNTIDTVQNIDNKLKSIYKRIYDNHKNDLFKPANVYVSKKSRVRPNYMLQYANNDYKTFYFSGTPFTRFSIFSKNNLMPPISFKELQQIFHHN